MSDAAAPNATSTTTPAPTETPVATVNPSAKFRARVAKLVESSSSDEGSAEASAPDAPETPAAPPTQEAAPDPEADLIQKRRAILEEKLAEQRARNQSRLLAEQHRREREQIEADRKAAAEERARWEGARKDYKKAFEQMGLSPREVYEEMTRQALEADTPQAQIRSMQEAWKSELASTLEREVTPLKKTIEQLNADRAALAERNHETSIPCTGPVFRGAA